MKLSYRTLSTRSQQRCRHGARWPVRLGLGSLLLLALSLLPASPAAAYDELVFCVDPLNMPYSQQGGFPPGFDMEIATRIAQILERQPQFYWADTGTVGGLGRALRRSINDEKCNAFMGIVQAPELADELEEKHLELTDPYMAVGLVLIVHPNSPPIRHVADLADKLTAIQNATYGHRVVIVNKYEYRRFRFENEILEVVEKQEVDAALLFGPMAGWYIHQNFQGRDVAISKEFEPEGKYRWNIGIAVRKPDVELKADLNRAIAQLLRDGEVEPILAKYGVPNLQLVSN